MFCVGEIGSSRLQYRVYFIKSRQLCTFEVREDEMQTITMKTSDGCVQVDLPTGRLTVDASVRPLAEYLALTFAIGVIFVTMHKPSYLLVMAAKVTKQFLTDTKHQMINFKSHALSVKNNRRKLHPNLLKFTAIHIRKVIYTQYT